MSARYEFLDHDGVLAFAHRGGNSVWPENTMPAFQHAVDLGYRYLETDVHLSADGVLYAFHDENLLARTGVNASFGDLTAAEIDRLKVDDVAHVPRLDEVLHTWPNARLNLDTKSDASVRPLIDAVRKHQLLDRICIGSFSDRRIRECRKELGPGLCTSMGQFEAIRLLIASRGFADPKLLVGACAQVPQKFVINIVDERLVSLAHEFDIQVHVWTIDDPADMRALLNYNVDGIMTDHPAVLRDVLLDRNKWGRGRSH